MANSPKIELNKGEEFVGRIKNVTNGVGGRGNKPWRMVIMEAITPWERSNVTIGQECVWFTPQGKDYDCLSRGAIIKIGRPAVNRYVVEEARGKVSVDVEAIKQPVDNRAGGTKLLELVVGAYKVAYYVAVNVHNKMVLEKLTREGIDKDTEFMLQNCLLRGPEIAALAHTLIIGEQKGEYRIPRASVGGDNG